MMWKKGVNALVLTLAAILLAGAAHATTIVFDYSYDSNGFFNNENRKAVLEEAGAFFSKVLTDDLLPIKSSDSNTFTARFTRPDTGKSAEISGFSIEADTIKIFAGGRNFSGSTLGHGGPGGYYISYSDSDWKTDVITRGETPDESGVRGEQAYDFAPWGGAVSFDLDAEWFFDTTPWDDSDLPGDKNDFFSVALHEIAHVLGFGTRDSWENLINGDKFTGQKATEVYGENPPLYGDKSHWAKGTMSTVLGILQEAAMDPSLTTGHRKYMTELDLAALDDIGWDIAPVPVPSALWLLGSGMAILAAARRRKSS